MRDPTSMGTEGVVARQEQTHDKGDLKFVLLLRAEVPFTVKLTKRSVDKGELEKILEKAMGVPQDQPE